MFDRCRLRVALNNDEAPQHRTVFAGDFLPDRLSVVLAAWDHAIFDLWGQEDTPAVFRHFHVVELGPTLWINADSGAQVNKAFLKAVRAKAVPPVKITRVPFFKGFQNPAVA